MRNDNLEKYVKLRRELSQERDELSRRLATINKALGHLPSEIEGGAEVSLPPVMDAQATVSTGKRSMSPAARARIAAAQRKRWAAAKGNSGGTQAAAKNGSSSGKRQMSPAARKKIAEAARKRWAVAKRAGKNRL
jgi:hypothetical protein